jgi:hypothetical protein
MIVKSVEGSRKVRSGSIMMRIIWKRRKNPSRSKSLIWKFFYRYSDSASCCEFWRKSNNIRTVIFGEFAYPTIEVPMRRLRR